MRFRPGGLVVGPGRATRRGYQRAAGPPQSTGGQRTPANGTVRAYVARVMSWTVFPRRRYLVADQVGAGGMGTVWRAWDRLEHRWVAAKLARPDDAASLQRFARERSLRVRHRHVVQPTGRDGLFTMDLVRGGSVEQLLARHGPLPDSYVRVVLDQVLQALVAVHAAGVVHRDVKPGNLLLEPTGTGRPWVRLGDFGIAVGCGDPGLTRAPGGVGTGGYMPPEQVAGTTRGLHDVAVPHPQRSLPREPLEGGGVVGASQLGRDPAPLVAVPGAPDRAHAAGADLVGHEVAAAGEHGPRHDPGNVRANRPVRRGALPACGLGWPGGALVASAGCPTWSHDQATGPETHSPPATERPWSPSPEEVGRFAYL